MATLVLGAVGAAVGGPIGALIGSTIGQQVDRAVFLDGGDRVREAPRLSDASVQSSALGTSIPLVFGTARVAGNVLWSSGLQEERMETSQGGGKGGGGSTTTVEFSYHASVAVGLSARPINRIERIWADGKLLRDASGSLLVPVEIRVHTGAETQEPDPLLQAAEGLDLTPPFRGLAYVVLEDLDLAEFANRIPNLSFEVVADEPATLGGMLAELSERAGLENVAASGLDEIVDGLAVARESPLRSSLEALLAAFPAISAEGSGALAFRPLGGGAARSVLPEDFGAAPEAAERAPRLAVERRQGADLPLQFELSYGDPARDYQPAVQRARLQLGHTHRRERLDTPLVLAAERAKRQADRLLARAWQRQESHRLQLPLRFAELEPGDRLLYQADGRSVELVIDELEIAAGHVAATGTPVTPFAALADGAESGAFPAPAITPPGESVVHGLEFPGLGRESMRPQAFLAGAGASPAWRGAGVFVSRDGGVSFELFASVLAPAVIGETTTALPAGPVAIWDEGSSVDIALLREDDSLESRAQLSVLNGANRAMIGNELVQFREADLLANGQFRLSGLLRGRNGTEAAVTSHSAGERFVLLDGGGLVPVAPPLETIGQSLLLKPVTRGRMLEETAAQPLTVSGASLRPLSPVHLRGRRSGGGDLEMTWSRRTRIGGAWLDGTDVPLGEEIEAYEIDILANGQPVRTIATDAPSAVYTAAAQAADFGAPQSAVEIAVYQMSAIIGRGAPGIETL